MGDNVHYAMKRVIGERGNERNDVLPATVCAASYGGECLVIKRTSGNEWYVEAHQRAQGRREQRGSMSDGKGKGQRLAERATSLNKK